MGNEAQNDLSSQELTACIRSWLYDAVPKPPLNDVPAQAVELINFLDNLRQVLKVFSTGNIDYPVQIRGFMGGHLKSLQANLRHLTWQARMVATGDLRQRVSFMGEFSMAFNEMVEQMQHNLQEIASNRDKLAELNEALLERIKRQEVTEENLKRSEKHFRRLAITDSLTGVLTRQHFFVTVSLELARSIKEKDQMCLLMIDVDHFKQVNDTYGHLVGDQVLRSLAGRFKTALRDRDILARYGGEEFIVLLPRATLEMGVRVAERLRQGVAGNPVATKDGNIQITVSLGIAYFNPRSSSSVNIGKQHIDPLLLNIINVADLALYKAKNQGRNKVVCGEPQNGDFSEIMSDALSAEGGMESNA